MKILALTDSKGKIIATAQPIKQPAPDSPIKLWFEPTQGQRVHELDITDIGRVSSADEFHRKLQQHIAKRIRSRAR
jgi:hypothetical protein